MKGKAKGRLEKGRSDTMQTDMGLALPEPMVRTWINQLSISGLPSPVGAADPMNPELLN